MSNIKYPKVNLGYSIVHLQSSYLEGWKLYHGYAVVRYHQGHVYENDTSQIYEIVLVLYETSTCYIANIAGV